MASVAQAFMCKASPCDQIDGCMKAGGCLYRSSADEARDKMVAHEATEMMRQGSNLLAHATPKAPTDPKVRKSLPICTGVLDYFPDALLAVAEVSRMGNDQHNPGQPLHWAREKSTDHADCVVRHLIDRGTRDKDGGRHSAKVAWRALALLQTEIEMERESQS